MKGSAVRQLDRNWAGLRACFRASAHTALDRLRRQRARLESSRRTRAGQGRVFAYTVIAVLTGSQPSPAEKAALDQAIMAAYHHAGITADQRTWARPAPLLGDLAAALRAGATPAAITLADRLVPYTSGTHAALFSAPTTTRPAGHLVVFSLCSLA